MTNHFNELTPAQAERLAILAEEMGEAIQAIGKILRHGYESTNPLDNASLPNREYLVRELGDVQAAMIMLENAGDVDSDDVTSHCLAKLVRIKKWLHHQED